MSIDLKYKATLHFPTESYGFAEVEIEVDSPEQAIAAYKAAIKPQNGLEKKEYDRFMESYLLGEMNGLGDLYERMNDEQKSCVQTIKRAMARLKAKEQKLVVTE